MDFKLPEDKTNLDIFILMMAFISGLIVATASILIFSPLQDESLGSNLDQEISAKQAGEKTVDFVNKNILEKSPNEVEAKFISAESAEDEGLPEFYKVKINVTNPTSSQVTEVFTRKNGDLVFLQFPRKMGSEEFDPDRYH